MDDKCRETATPSSLPSVRDLDRVVRRVISDRAKAEAAL